MESQKDAFRRRYSGMTDKELLDAYQNRFETFCEAAKDAFNEVLKERGGVDMVKLRAGAGHSSSVDGKGEEVTGVRTLSDETVKEVQFALINGAAGQAEPLLANVQKRLQEAYMPLQCRWGVVEVKTKGWVSRVRRDFLIVEVEEFPDYHNYISVRNFGTYLDCLRALTMEPNFVKKILSRKLTGDEEGLSAPKNLLKFQDLNSWNNVVNDCMKKSIDALVERLGQKPGQFRYGERNFLDIW